MTISFDFIYCLINADERFWSYLYIVAEGETDTFWIYTNPDYDTQWYGARLPRNVSAVEVDGAYTITPDSSTLLLTECDAASGAPINVIPTTYNLGVMADSFTVWFANRMQNLDSWFMIRFESWLKVECCRFLKDSSKMSWVGLGKCREMLGNLSENACILVKMLQSY